MIDECVLRNDMLLLASNFKKIIEVNLAENTYYVVKVADKERVMYSDVARWAKQFAAEGQVHPDDETAFLQFFESFRNVEKFKRKQIFYYRRKEDRDWINVCLEVVPMENYTEDDPIVLILVRDIDEYLHEWYSRLRR